MPYECSVQLTSLQQLKISHPKVQKVNEQKETRETTDTKSISVRKYGITTAMVRRTYLEEFEIKDWRG